MKTHDIRVANYVGWHRDSGGYLKDCKYQCGHTIYMHRDWDGQWRPYKSWAAGDVREGVFELHDCGCRD